MINKSLDVFNLLRALYYTKTKSNPLMDNIIKDTIHRFKNPFQNSKNKWKNLHQYVVKEKISDISDSQYSDMFV